MLLAKPVVGCYAILCNPIPNGEYQLEDGVTSFVVTSLFVSQKGNTFILRNTPNSDECFNSKNFMFYAHVNGNEKTLGVPNAKNNSL